MAAASEIRSIQEDLRTFDAWLATQDDGSNTYKLHSALVSQLLGRNDPTTETRIKTAELLPLLNGRGGQPPDSVRHFAPKDTQKAWWSSRRGKYHRYAHEHSVRPLLLQESGTRPLSFGYDIDNEAATGILAETAIHYTREPVPPAEMAWFGRILYPNAEISLRSWRRHVHTGKAVITFLWFVATVLMTWIVFAFRRWNDWIALTNAIVLGLSAWAVYRTIMVPSMRFNTMRMKMANSSLIRFKYWQKPDPQWEIMRFEKEGRGKAIELVRWHGDCPICGAIVDVVDDDPHHRDMFVGRCRETVEHLFSFDRMTGEGRALRSRLR